MVDLTPGAAFLVALQNQFAAARQGQGRGQGSSIPGLSGQPNSDPGNALNALSGISGGGVPGTATTGASVAAAGAPSSSLDPIAQQVLSSTGGSLTGTRDGPSDRGDLGAGVTGGDLETLLSVMGGPMAIPTLLAALVGSTDLGLPPSTNLNALLGSDGAALGISFADRATGLDGPTNTGLSPPPSTTQNLGSLGISFADRDRTGPPGQGGGNSGQFDTPEFGV